MSDQKPENPKDTELLSPGKFNSVIKRMLSMPPQPIKKEKKSLESGTKK